MLVHRKGLHFLDQAAAAHAAAIYDAGVVPLFVPVMDGALPYAGALLGSYSRLLSQGQSATYATVRAASYGAGVIPTTVEIKDCSRALDLAAGRLVWVLDDVLDTGGTFHLLQSMLYDAGAAAVKLAVAAWKERPGVPAPDLHGVKLDAADFLVGYGMDDAGEKRLLPFLAAKKEGY